MLSSVSRWSLIAFKTQNKKLFSTLAPSMFEKYNHNLDLHFVASSLIRYPVSVSIAVQHACAAELYVMMCGIRTPSVYKVLSQLLQREELSFLCSYSLLSNLLIIMMQTCSR